MNLITKRSLTVLVVLAVGAGIFLNYNSRARCPITKEKREVQGNSLTGVLEGGTMITLLRGYYACHAPELNDIIAFRAAGYDEPVIKVLRGMPGDEFDLQQSDAGNHLLLNGQVLVTATGKPYSMTDNQAKFFKTFVDRYQGSIPRDHYMILGEVPGGSADSIFYGLIDTGQLIGKIER